MAHPLVAPLPAGMEPAQSVEVERGRYEGPAVLVGVGAVLGGLVLIAALVLALAGLGKLTSPTPTGFEASISQAVK